MEKLKCVTTYQGEELGCSKLHREFSFGRVIFQKYYVDKKGVIQGLFLTYNYAGACVWEEVYQDGIRLKGKHLHLNGLIHFEFTCLNSRIHGFFSNGSFSHTEQWNEGNLLA